MFSRIRHLRRDERGMSLIYVGFGLVAFMTVGALAVDVGLVATSRSQAQNAADAGALAGAVALAVDDYNNRAASGPAVQNALETARNNHVMHGTVNITPADVTFPAGPGGLNNRVHLTVRRTAANAVPTLAARLFRVNSVDVVAAATAEASKANAMTCVKPFIIPDKWDERNAAPWDVNDTFEMYDQHGNMLANPDVYVPADQPGYTGYSMMNDRGTRLTIRAGGGHDINPTFYFSLAIGDETGGDEYSWNIGNCNTHIMHWGDLVIQEPGNMNGPTIQGVEELWARDPNAYWDTSRNRVVSTMNPSPRVFPIPLYDPTYYETGKVNGRFADLKVANWIGFFLEAVQGNEIIGRITHISGILDEGEPAPDGAIPYVIRLVE